MYMSLDSVADPVPQDMFSAGADTPDAAPPKPTRRIKTRWLLGTWLVLSVMWGAGVSYDLYQRISIQANMAEDVARDLDQGFVAASCTGTQCGGNNAIKQTQNWSGIASTYLKFGSTDMAEYTLGPPLALLFVGMGAMMLLRRRRPKRS